MYENIHAMFTWFGSRKIWFSSLILLNIKSKIFNSTIFIAFKVHIQLQIIEIFEEKIWNLCHFDESSEKMCVGVDSRASTTNLKWKKNIETVET